MLSAYPSNKLTSINGIENIDTSSLDDLFIYNNNSLSSCAVQSICNFLASPNGTIEIRDNASGCNSPEEVEYACLVDVENYPKQNHVSIYPNPLTEKLIVEFDAPPKEVGSIVLINSYGAIIKTHKVNTEFSEGRKLSFNVKDLPSGIYFLRLQIGNKVLARRVVKL